MSAAFAPAVPVLSTSRYPSSLSPIPRGSPRPPPTPAHRPRPARMVQQIDAPSQAALATFSRFFSAQPGAWNSQRTYHYLTPGSPQAREESQTTFDVERLSPDQVRAVLAANGSVRGDLEAAQGFRVSFLTRMGTRKELVRAGTNLAFVPEGMQSGRIVGAYYRDVGYEEKGAVQAAFGFDVGRAELQMVTIYSKVVSVDEIRLVNDNLRLRRIVNYQRPPVAGAALKDIVLVGYGVEVKGEAQRLVE